jgi:signal transduction histidine kinase
MGDSPSAGLPAEAGGARRQGMRLYMCGYLVLVPLGTVLLMVRHQPWDLYLAMGLTAGSYAIFALLPGQRRSGWPSVAYLTVACASAAWLCANQWQQSGLICVLVAQVFSLVRPARRAAVVSVLFGAGTGVLAFLRVKVGTETLTNALIVLAVVCGVGLLQMVYVMKLAEETSRRGRVIEELERTRADLAQAHHDAGVMAERERLSRDIHDTLAQGFTSVLMLIQAAMSAVPPELAATRERLELAAEVARSNVREAQALVAATASADLDDVSLETALSGLIERLTRESGVNCQLETAGPARAMTPATQVIMLRTAQEALANVRKHARASKVCVRLRFRARTVVLEVADDGRGFGSQLHGGFGLRGIRQRARQAGGSAEIITAPGAGTTIRVEIPDAG